MELKDIPGFPGYRASPDGTIHGHFGQLKHHRSADGYCRVRVGSRSTEVTTRTVHSLVASAFLGPRPHGWCVAHKNGKRDDNRLDNLQYTTYSANLIHRRGGTVKCPLLQSEAPRPRSKCVGMARGEKHGLSKITEALAICIHALCREGYTRHEIADETGVSYISVCHILAGRRWTHLAASGVGPVLKS